MDLDVVMWIVPIQQEHSLRQMLCSVELLKMRMHEGKGASDTEPLGFLDHILDFVFGKS